MSTPASSKTTPSRTMPSRSASHLPPRPRRDRRSFCEPNVDPRLASAHGPSSLGSSDARPHVLLSALLAVYASTASPAQHTATSRVSGESQYRLSSSSLSDHARSVWRVLTESLAPLIATRARSQSASAARLLPYVSAEQLSPAPSAFPVRHTGTRCASRASSDARPHDLGSCLPGSSARTACHDLHTSTPASSRVFTGDPPLVHQSAGLGCVTPSRFLAARTSSTLSTFESTDWPRASHRSEGLVRSTSAAIVTAERVGASESHTALRPLLRSWSPSTSRGLRGG